MHLSGGVRGTGGSAVASEPRPLGSPGPGVGGVEGTGLPGFLQPWLPPLAWGTLPAPARSPSQAPCGCGLLESGAPSPAGLSPGRGPGGALVWLRVSPGLRRRGCPGCPAECLQRPPLGPFGSAASVTAMWMGLETPHPLFEPFVRAPSGRGAQVPPCRGGGH